MPNSAEEQSLTEKENDSQEKETVSTNRSEEDDQLLNAFSITNDADDDDEMLDLSKSPESLDFTESGDTQCCTYTSSRVLTLLSILLATQIRGK